MSSSTQVPSPSIDLGSTYGALFIGVIFSAFLFGLTNIQAFIYFQTQTGRWTKFYRLAVFWLWILDGLHLALIVHCVYYYLVTNFANFTVLTDIVWSFKLQVVINILIVYVTLLMYSHRIWIVGKDRSRAFLMIPGIVVVLGSGIAISLIWLVYRRDPSASLGGIRWPTFMALGAAASLDMFVASSLCYLLATSRTGFPTTDAWLKKLIGYTIDTGCLTSICSLTSIIFCAAMPHSFIFLSVQFLVAKLYVNSYIALLNARYYMQSNTDTANSSQLCVPQRDSFVHHLSPEKFPGFRKWMRAHPEVEMALPNSPAQVALARRPILVTVKKESFVDF